MSNFLFSTTKGSNGIAQNILVQLFHSGNHLLVLFAIRTSISITGTSTSTPTTVPNAARIVNQKETWPQPVQRNYLHRSFRSEQLHCGVISTILPIHKLQRKLGLFAGQAGWLSKEYVKGYSILFPLEKRTG